MGIVPIGLFVFHGGTPMLFKNESSQVVCLPALGIPRTEPGECVEIPDGFCKPGRTDGGQRKKSPIEMYAPQLRPANPDERAEWEKIPAPVKPDGKSTVVTSERMRAASGRPIPPGVQAAMLAKKAAQAKPAAPAPSAPTPAPAPVEKPKAK